jgi:CDP-6-deoxy-D-xylo-4-hexulose-3-dehydrase
MTDIQAAIGLAQMDKLAGFVAARRRNFARLYDGLQAYEEHLILPEAPVESVPSWFAFPVTVRPGAPFSRRDLAYWLEDRNIETRLLFAGNVVRQPGFRSIEHQTVGELRNADLIMRSSLFFGVYPGLDDARLAYMLTALEDFFTAHG